MKVLKLNSKGTEVLYLQQLLIQKGYKIIDDGDFGQNTLKAVKDFQNACMLTADGIVGQKTWNKLLDMSEPKQILSELDYIECAQLLGVEVAIVKAIAEVESGTLGGFLPSGHPTILFEGHIFWNELKKRNKSPEQYVNGNENILYPSWTKKYYKLGESEVLRLEQAIKIDKIAALSSASWGMFQIMGFNYKVCDCYDINDFVTKMKSNCKEQLKLFIKFILNNKLDIYLKKKDWAGFANKYNGLEYAQNQYDIKLEKAYNKYK